MMASDIKRGWPNMVASIIFDAIIISVIMMLIIHVTERGKQVVINAMHFTETTTGSDSRPNMRVSV